MKDRPIASEPPHKTNPKQRWTDAFMCVLIAILMVGMQYRSGAYRADLAFDPDEPAHAVSSLMVHDYLVHALGKNPISYAQTYYAHYPKVAIGHWPPLFFAAEGIWMLVAGRSRIALLLFVALCATALTCSMYLLVRRNTSFSAALVSVAVLVHPRFFQEMLMTVHPEMLLALCVFGAAVFCGRWMAQSDLRNGVLFVLCAIAALGVNGRGAVVLLLPFAMLPLRKGAVRSRWIIAGAVVLAVFLAEPYLTWQTDPFNVRIAAQMGLIFAQQTIRTVAFPALVLAASGMLLAFGIREHRTFWWAMAATVGCGFICFLLLPALWDDRYLLTTLPAAAALAGLAAYRPFDLVKHWRTSAQAVVALLASAVIGFTIWQMEIKPDRGYRVFVASETFKASPVVLVDGDGISEGGLIVEGCLADPHTERTVMRGSKAIAHATWIGKEFRLLYRSTAEVESALHNASVGLVVVQDASRRDDAELLRSTMSENRLEWEPVPATTPAPAGTTLYHRLSIR